MDMFIKPDPLPLSTDWLIANCTVVDEGGYCFGEITETTTAHLVIEDNGIYRLSSQRWQVALARSKFNDNAREAFYCPTNRYVQTPEEIYELCKQLCIAIPEKKS